MKAFKFHPPTSIAVLEQTLENADSLFVQPPEFVVYCYKEWLPMFDEMKDSVKELILHQGVPSREQMEEWAQGRHFILVLDDLQQVCENKRDVAEMFTVGSHHLNFSVIYLCHNIFGRGQFARLIYLNSHYMFIF